MTRQLHGVSLAAALVAVVLHAQVGLTAAKCAAGDDACGMPEDEVSLLSVSRAVISGMRADDRKAGDPQAAKGEPDKEEFIPRFLCEELGPLKGLVGEWEGVAGISVNRIPTAMTDPNNGTLYVEYTESLKFEPISGLVLNRGFAKADQVGQEGRIEQKIFGISYVHSLKGAFGQGVHSESGQWLFNSVPGIANWSIARLSAIPHGVSMTAYGDTSVQELRDVLQEQETVNDLKILGLQEQIRDRMQKGIQNSINIHTLAQSLYTQTDLTYNMKFGDVMKRAASSLLVGEASDLRATRLQVNTNQDGSGFTMMQDVRYQTPVSNFTGQYWLFENTPVPVLQYFQNVYLNFEVADFAPESCYSTSPAPMECLRSWPHFQVSTLTKVKGYEGC